VACMLASYTYKLAVAADCLVFQLSSPTPNPQLASSIVQLASTRVASIDRDLLVCNSDEQVSQKYPKGRTLYEVIAGPSQSKNNQSL